MGGLPAVTSMEYIHNLHQQPQAAIHCSSYFDSSPACKSSYSFSQSWVCAFLVSCFLILARTSRIHRSSLVRAQLLVETITLFDVAGPSDIPNPNSFGLSVLGVNSQGETTYVEDGVASLGIQVQSTTTQVFEISASRMSVHCESIDSSAKQHPSLLNQKSLVTFVEDASHMVESVTPTISGQTGFAQTCTWGSDGQGECVAEVSVESTEFFTFTGTKSPYTTLIVSVPTSSSATAAFTTTSSNYASSPRFSTIGVTQLVIAMSIITILQAVGGSMVLF